ncbi:Protein twist [Aphelenchoides besseyi]|nr:Protein twist [Aphelenchoides besseyi]
MAGKGERLRDNFGVKEADDWTIKNPPQETNSRTPMAGKQNFVANCGAEFSSENQQDSIAVPDCGSDLSKISTPCFWPTIYFETMKNSRENRTRSRCRNPDSLHIQRDRANKRERERTKVFGVLVIVSYALNAAYIELRRKIPSLPSDKTSKIHTLRVTVEYIQFLRELIYNQNGVLNRMDFAVHDDNQINLQATFNSWRTNHNQHWSAGMTKQTSFQRRTAEVSDKRKPKLQDSFARNKTTASNDLYSATNIDYSKLNTICQHMETTSSQVPLHHPIEKPKSEFDLSVNLSSQYADQAVQPFPNPDCHSASTLSYALSYAINHTHL